MYDDATWERYGLFGAVWFVVLQVVAIAISGSPPGTESGPNEIQEYFQDNDTTIQLATWLAAVAGIGIIVWFGSLWRAMRRAEDDRPMLAVVALAGLLFAGATAGVAAAINSATALHIDNVGQGSQFFYGLQSMLYGTTLIGLVVLVGAVSALVLRTGFLPEWMAWAGAAVVVVAGVGSLAAATGREAITLIGFIGFMLFLIWLLVITYLLYRGPEPAEV